MIRSLLFALLALAALGAAPARAEDAPGRFDYWTLVLSWSPSYCESDDGRRDRDQCGRGRAFAFVVHGLWPQYERGWPQNCATRDRFVPERTIDSMLDIMPSKRLVIHEWRKHGTCSGLSQTEYFAATRRLYKGLRIPQAFQSPGRMLTTTPAAIEEAFVIENPGLEESMISVDCGRRRDNARLRDVRICFDRKLRLRPCGDNEARSCRARSVTMPPSR